MRLAGKVAVVTGAAGGIGAALCRRFAAEGAAGICVSDRPADPAGRAGPAVPGHAGPGHTRPGHDVRGHAGPAHAGLAGPADVAEHGDHAGPSTLAYPGDTGGTGDPAGFDAAGAAEALAAGLRAGGTAAIAVAADVGDQAEVDELVARCERRLGPVDLFCANAGVASGAGLDATDGDWARAWSVNVLGHLHAARAVLPGMLERGSGYLLHTCSAAGLLTAPGDAPYTVTKHAAVGFAEWLAIEYGGAGIGVSALCPQGVRTSMLTDPLAAGNDAARFVAASGEVLDPERVADAVIEGLAAERFLILPHPEVAGYLERKATDPDRWLAGMRRLRRHP